MYLATDQKRQTVDWLEGPGAGDETSWRRALPRKEKARNNGLSKDMTSQAEPSTDW